MTERYSPFFFTNEDHVGIELDWEHCSLSSWFVPYCGTSKRLITGKSCKMNYEKKKNLFEKNAFSN